METAHEIINYGVSEFYADGLSQFIEDDVVHTTLWVARNGEKHAVAIVHMSRAKHAASMKALFRTVCGLCTARGLQALLACCGLG